MSEKVYSPWARPQGMVPAMARYQSLYGFKPQSGHGEEIHKILGEITQPCQECSETGILGACGETLLLCPNCKGFGVTYTVSLEELEAKRQKVLSLYPDAGVPDWQPYVRIRCPIYDIKGGIVSDACPDSGSSGT